MPIIPGHDQPSRTGHRPRTDDLQIPHPGRDRTYAQTGGGGGGTDSELLAARQTLQKTTGSIAAGAAEDGTLDFSSRAVELLILTSNKKCRVRFYTTSAARAADASRDRSTDPLAGKGVLGEFIFAVAATIPVSPPIFLYNADGTAANSIYYRIDNDESSSTTITLDLVHLDMEPSA